MEKPSFRVQRQQQRLASGGHPPTRQSSLPLTKNPTSSRVPRCDNGYTNSEVTNGVNEANGAGYCGGAWRSDGADSLTPIEGEAPPPYCEESEAPPPYTPEDPSSVLGGGGAVAGGGVTLSASSGGSGRMFPPSHLLQSEYELDDEAPPPYQKYSDTHYLSLEKKKTDENEGKKAEKKNNSPDEAGREENVYVDMPFMRNTLDRFDESSSSGAISESNPISSSSVTYDDQRSSPHAYPTKPISANAAAAAASVTEAVYQNLSFPSRKEFDGDAVVAASTGVTDISAITAASSAVDFHIGRLTLPHMNGDRSSSNSSVEDAGRDDVHGDLETEGACGAAASATGTTTKPLKITMPEPGQETLESYDSPRSRGKDYDTSESTSSPLLFPPPPHTHTHAHNLPPR